MDNRLKYRIFAGRGNCGKNVFAGFNPVALGILLELMSSFYDPATLREKS